MNDILSNRGLEAVDFPKDLQNGALLIHLAECLTKSKAGKFRNDPKLRPHRLDNLQVAFNLLQKNGLKLVNVGPEDVFNGNRKLILGLLWAIIQKFHIVSSGNSTFSAEFECYVLFYFF